jgi:hypothetical protein
VHCVRTRCRQVTATLFEMLLQTLRDLGYIDTRVFFGRERRSRNKLLLYLAKLDNKSGFGVTWKHLCSHIRGCIQKFPVWPPGAKTANGTALCYRVQLYRYFVSQSSEFCRHSPLCCFSMSVCCCCCYCLFCHRLSLETFGYTLVHSIYHYIMRHKTYIFTLVLSTSSQLRALRQCFLNCGVALVIFKMLGIYCLI